MTVLSAAVIAVVVWAIGQIRSTRWRAVVYALPVPITLVLATTSLPVDAHTVLGVAALALFMVTVAALHGRLHWPVLLADLAGAAVYALAGGLIARLPALPFWPVVTAVVAAWALTAGVVLARPGTSEFPAPVTSTPAGSVVKLLAVFAAALATIALGGVLRGLVVTFPYSGVLVVVEARNRLASFTRHFLIAGLGLVLFLAAFHLAQGWGRPAGIAAGWLAATACVVAVGPLQRLLARRESPNDARTE